MLTNTHNPKLERKMVNVGGLPAMTAFAKVGRSSVLSPLHMSGDGANNYGGLSISLCTETLCALTELLRATPAESWGSDTKS